MNEEYSKQEKERKREEETRERKEREKKRRKEKDGAGLSGSARPIRKEGKYLTRYSHLID